MNHKAIHTESSRIRVQTENEGHAPLAAGAAFPRAASALRIVVMKGGPSAEREVSLRTGTAVAIALRSLGHEVHEVDPREPGWALPRGTHVVFLALHGTYGEDGTIQRELDMMGVPYTGCDAQASRIGFDKLLTKERCLAAGVKTPRFVLVDSTSAPWPVGWMPPLVVKPVRQGSSVGLRFVDRIEDWPGALEEALRHDSQVLVEERVFGQEVTVGILGDKALPLVEVRPRSGVYDYHSKYTSGETEYFCPAPLDEAMTERAQAAALAAFRAIGGRDYARVDMIISADGCPWVLEINTLPGMTETSLLPKAARASGISYADLCLRMADLALKRGPSLY
jgi:D-alanine-D-alanine ligase